MARSPKPKLVCAVIHHGELCGKDAVVTVNIARGLSFVPMCPEHNDFRLTQSKLTERGVRIEDSSTGGYQPNGIG